MRQGEEVGGGDFGLLVGGGVFALFAGLHFVDAVPRAAQGFADGAGGVWDFVQVGAGEVGQGFSLDEESGVVGSGVLDGAHGLSSGSGAGGAALLPCVVV